MTMAQAAPKLPIKVVVRAAALEPPELCPESRAITGEAIRLAILNYAARLAADLGLPATVTVVVEDVPDDKVPKEWPFLLTIGGKPARLNLRRPRTDLVVDVPSEIYRNRNLLLTPEVAKAWSPACGTPMSLRRHPFERCSRLWLPASTGTSAWTD